MRLVVELSDADSNTALWRSRYDETIADLLDVQDRLAEGVVCSVAPRVRAAELQRLRIKRPEDYGAYEFFLRAHENMRAPSREVCEGAGHLLEQAIAREPHYAAALAWLAYWHVLRVGQGWSSDRTVDTQRAEHFARRAAECDPFEPMALAVQGLAAAYLRKDLSTALECFDAALRSNPNSARAWLWGAYVRAWNGEGGAAVAGAQRAMALSPYDPFVCFYSAGASLAYLADGQYDRSIEYALRCLRENRGYTGAYKVLISSLVLAGAEKDAQAPVNQLRLLEPNFTVASFRRSFPGSGNALAESYCDAFARAGIPLSD